MYGGGVGGGGVEGGSLVRVSNTAGFGERDSCHERLNHAQLPQLSLQRPPAAPPLFLSASLLLRLLFSFFSYSFLSERLSCLAAVCILLTAGFFSSQPVLLRLSDLCLFVWFHGGSHWK